MNQKEFNVKYFEKDDTPNVGYIEGYASTWDLVPDAYGDVVKKGAFVDSLNHFLETGRSIPLLWSHQMDQLSAYIGTCVAEEDDRGLKFTAKFDDTEEAQRIRQLYKDGRLSKFSFAYDTLEQGPITLENGTKANELRKLDIFEISCVLVPANGFAEVIDIKSGKRNSAKDEQTIRSLIKLLQDLLGEDVDSEDNVDDNAGQAKDQDAINEKQKELLEIIKNL